MEEHVSWQQLEHHFHLCLAMDAEQQSHYLRALKQHDADMVDELLVLLQGDAEAESEQFFEENPLDPFYGCAEANPSSNHFERLLNTPLPRLKLSAKNRLLLAAVSRR
ncbi:hypothetical protein [Acanthopleuribacter pedis]|uniref:Uncharacterized protein n=1 Tax=Acanthopleuribacter pedis TaxID=442870 RepID=A0A8J7Q5V0_9BACT|nr:hypothetical protein [Acanthopleuribacter pedis]MBO1321022.1 hypothetical protein [Acanthopleuribacter pedis]